MYLNTVLQWVGDSLGLLQTDIYTTNVPTAHLILYYEIMNGHPTTREPYSCVPHTLSLYLKKYAQIIDPQTKTDKIMIYCITINSQCFWFFCPYLCMN